MHFTGEVLIIYTNNTKFLGLFMVRNMKVKTVVLYNVDPNVFGYKVISNMRNTKLANVSLKYAINGQK